MAKNQVLFQRGLSLPQLLNQYGNEAQCHCQTSLTTWLLRRFKLQNMIRRLGYAAVRTPPMPHRLLSVAEAWG